tara:strand:- start:210 stop:662 length:453 start_codon:yes stop_codon:yes gene_type:complete
LSPISTIDENNQINISKFNSSNEHTKHSSNTNNNNLVIPLTITASVFVSVFILFIFLKRKKNNFDGIYNNQNNENNQDNEDNQIIANNKDANLYLEPTPLTRSKQIFNNVVYNKNTIYDETYEEINDNQYVYGTNILSNTENKEYMSIND